MITRAQTARRANEQIRRLRAALQDARDTLCDHFGAQDDSVTACDRALSGDTRPTMTSFARAVCGHTLQPWQAELLQIFEADRIAQRPPRLARFGKATITTLPISDEQRDAAARLGLAPVTENPFNKL